MGGHGGWARSLLIALLALIAGRAGAESESLRRAKVLYFEGKKEFEVQRYEPALHLFERAYEVSSRPGFLFNIAACLSALDRPREAAAKLREYLNLVPDDPQRAAIEDSIGELKARAVEQEAAVHAEREATRGNDPQRAALEARIRLLEERLGSTPPPRSRRRLAIGLGVTAGVLVIAGTALTLGLVLNRGDSHTPSSFGGGPFPSTP